MNETIEAMLALKRWAVIGASDDRSRYGWKVRRKLLDHGYEAYPVNPRLKSIDGEKCFDLITGILPPPDAACFIINPKRGLELIDEVAGHGVRNVWFQPGAIDDELRRRAKALDLKIVEDCVLVQLDGRSSGG